MIIKKFKKGFTLIELLVVIGVLAVIAAGVVSLINPQDKIRQANDAKIQSDIGQLATGIQSYAAQQPSGTYPVNLNALLTSGELKSVPLTPAGGAYGYTPLPAGCLGTAASPCTDARIHQALTSLKYTSVATADTWVYCTSNGRVGATADTATCMP